MPWWRNHSSSAGNYLLSYLVEFITGWSNWILLRKLNYSICFFIDVIVKLERALSNSLQSTSVLCITLFWTTLYSRGSFLVYSWPVLLLCLLLSKMFRLTWSNCLAHFFPWRIIQSIVRLHQIWLISLLLFIFTGMKKLILKLSGCQNHESPARNYGKSVRSMKFRPENTENLLPFNRGRKPRFTVRAQ